MMSHLLRYTLLAGCAALALCVTTRAAHAQMVDPKGTGEHLLFAYWSTADYTNTLVNIHSPLGVRSGTQTMNVVKVTVRDKMGAEATQFNICLTPGDFWTASLTSEGLQVGDPGDCDDDVQPPTGVRVTPALVQTPPKGEMVSLGTATSGYLEAWLAPDGALKDDAVITATEGPDSDVLPEDATPQYISGSAMLVSAMSGFSSTYNATALTGCGNAAGDRISKADADIAIVDDGDGCWTITDTDGAIVDDGDGEPLSDGAPITSALTALDQDLLTGRWTAIADEDVTSNTKLVLTFPVNHLNYAANTANDIAAGTDPVSLYVFNDVGEIALRSHTVMLGRNVNMCTFKTSGDMADDPMSGDMADPMPMLSCNDMEVGALNDMAMAGGFRIFNNTMEDGFTDDDPPVFVSGTETAGFGVDTTADATGTGQLPAEPLNALGLIFSYFMGTDGNQYDQVTPVQPVSIDASDATPPYGNL